jgi:hypothetical protein
MLTIRPPKPLIYSLTSALDEGGWSTPHPGRLTPGKDPVPIVQEAGWAPAPFWTCVENLAPTGIRSLDRPAHSKSLYRLSYPGPRKASGNLVTILLRAFREASARL